MQRRWILGSGGNPAAVADLARQLPVLPFVAERLWRNGLTNCENALAFLHPRLKSLSDPFLLPHMRPAVERILAAIDRREKIVLYGDYDVDGVTSLALLARLLRAYGSDVACFLPLRMDEGYGLTAEGAERCLTTLAPRLLIAVDCGTASAREIASLQSGGVDVIVLDHHELKATLPDCVAVVNPKLGNDFGYLCSVGIVFKVCHALLKGRPLPEFSLRNCLDLVAVGTVADLVPLVEENRILVNAGAARLADTHWPGLRALLDMATVRPPIRPADIGFRIAPRLNAAGRLGTAQDALDLLLTDDPGTARALADRLNLQNRERQTVERRIYEEAQRSLDGSYDASSDAAIVVGARGWHAGVVGIVASRLARAHYRPSVVVAFGDDGVGKGSGRSIEGLSLVSALGQCAELLVKFGGHEMAAGITVNEDRFAAFQDAFRRCARSMLTDEQLQPVLRLDAELALDALTWDTLESHERLQPFGIGNEQPMFVARSVVPSGSPRVLKEKHLLLALTQGSSRRTVSAIYFNCAAASLPRPPWDVAFRIERNEYQGEVSVQMQVQHVRTAGEF